MTTLIIVIHTIVCLFLIGIVLLQHGKGADIGATFGGSSQSLFGTEGPMPLLNKITTLAAIVFMVTSITLAYLSAHKNAGSVMSDVKVQEQQVPAQQVPVAVPMPAVQPVEEKTPKEQVPAQQVPVAVPMPTIQPVEKEAPTGTTDLPPKK